MESNGSVRVAIIGYGLAGSVFHAPLIASTRGMSVRAIVTRDEVRRAAAQADFPEASILGDVEEIWNAPEKYDLVVVATSNRSHVPLGLAAIAAGLPVVVDKPLAVTVEDARRLVDASDGHGVLLSVFQNRRWDGDFLTVRALIERDLLGPLVRFESRFERYRPAPKKDAWRESSHPEEGGGLLLDLGSHLIDSAIVLFGRPQAVYAEMGTYRPGAQVDDDTFVALGFANNIHAHLWMNTTSRTPGPRLRVSGLRGTYTKYGLDPQEESLKAGMRPGDPRWGRESPDLWGSLSTDIDGLHIDGSVETLPGAYELYYAGLRDSLLQGAPLPVDPRDALQTLEVVEAARLSARKHVPVKMAPAL